MRNGQRGHSHQGEELLTLVSKLPQTFQEQGVFGPYLKTLGGGSLGVFVELLQIELLLPEGLFSAPLDVTHG